MRLLMVLCIQSSWQWAWLPASPCSPRRPSWRSPRVRRTILCFSRQLECTSAREFCETKLGCTIKTFWAAAAQNVIFSLGSCKGKLLQRPEVILRALCLGTPACCDSRELDSPLTHVFAFSVPIQTVCRTPALQRPDKRAGPRSLSSTSLDGAYFRRFRLLQPSFLAYFDDSRSILGLLAC
jgi:hypothetical protein